MKMEIHPQWRLLYFSEGSWKRRQTGTLHFALVDRTETRGLSNHAHTYSSKQVLHITDMDLI